MLRTPKKKIHPTKWEEIEKRRTRANVASDGAGDDEDTGADRSSDADENEVEQAESPDESIADSTNGVFRRRNLRLCSERRGAEIRPPRRRRRRIIRNSSSRRRRRRIRRNPRISVAPFASSHGWRNREREKEKTFCCLYLNYGWIVLGHGFV